MSSSLPTRFIIFTIFFIAIGCADMFMLANNPSLRWLTKPAIMLSLIGYFQYRSKSHSTPSYLFQIGMVAALLGDIFLLSNGESFFLIGLGSFLIMQILYIITFLRDSFNPNAPKYVASIMLLSILGFFIKTLWPTLVDMSIPVLIYSSFIVLMAMSAIMRDHKSHGYWWVVIGAVFFMISDGFIAWSKFINPINGSGLIIMGTYILAQYPIILGVLKKGE